MQELSVSVPVTWAIITPSYKGDFERCRILCESIDAFVVGNWHHYIIVETVDLGLFQKLSGGNRTILEMEAIMPRSFYHLTRIPFVNSRSLWFSFKTGFMIGWHVQQLVKLQMAFELNEQGLLYCDSDVFFIRPFDVSLLVENNQFRFYSTEHGFAREDAPNPTYIEASAKQLGLGVNPFPSPSYVENLVTWHSSTVKSLCGHIEKISGRDWKVALGRKLILSEYTLYGLYVDRVLADRNQLKLSRESFCKTAWHIADIGNAALDEFCDMVAEPQVAVGFQSFLGIKESALALQLQRAIKRFSLS